jgi:ABC-type Mn2+/Zn2+ transport system ATPase subunit
MVGPDGARKSSLVKTVAGVLCKAQAALEISDSTYVLASGTVKISAASQVLLSRDDLGDIFLGRSI